MDQFIPLALAMAAGPLAWIGVVTIGRQAEHLHLVTVPNDRSSHSVPTPRGGGLAIAVVGLLAALTLAAQAEPHMLLLAALIALTGLLGFLDDLYDLSPLIRLVAQCAAFIGLLWLGPSLPAIRLPLGLELSGAALTILLVLTGLWWLNLYNFMDGIDGLAASQAILLLVAGSVLYWMNTASEPISSTVWLALTVAAATAGFLVRNWSPAKIFMGDAGSNALAMIVFAVAVLSIADDAMNYAAWLILPAALVTDATVTLMRRLSRGERPWHAHRRHGYQQLARQWGHQRVTVIYACITAIWAFPLSLAAQLQDSWAWSIAVIAYCPLVWLSLWADAGGQHETVTP